MVLAAQLLSGHVGAGEFRANTAEARARAMETLENLSVLRAFVKGFNLTDGVSVHVWQGSSMRSWYGHYCGLVEE